MDHNPGPSPDATPQPSTEPARSQGPDRALRDGWWVPADLLGSASSGGGATPRSGVPGGRSRQFLAVAGLMVAGVVLGGAGGKALTGHSDDVRPAATATSGAPGSSAVPQAEQRFTGTQPGLGGVVSGDDVSEDEGSSGRHG